MSPYILVFIGGGLGSAVRLGINEIFRLVYKGPFPWSTLVSNFLSCLVFAIGVGFFYSKISENNSLRLFLLTGFCGGFSTFSTFSFETLELFKNGYRMLGIINIGLSLLVCIGVLYLLIKKI